MAAITVTATATGDAANDVYLTVKVVTGQASSPIGVAANSGSITTPRLAITPGHAGGWVYGALYEGGGSATFTAQSGTTFSQNVHTGSNSFGTFRSTSTTTTSSTTYGGSAPTGSSPDVGIALLEIIAASSGSLVEDSSSPAVASSTSAKTVTTASFTPPAGALLVAMFSANTDGNGVSPGQDSTVTDSSGLTWTKQSAGSQSVGGFSYKCTSVWTAQIAGSTAITLSDSGSCDDVSGIGVAVALSTTDTGSGTDTPTEGVAITYPADTGSGTDTETVAGAIALTDSGSGADTITPVAGVIAYTETGSGTDAVALQIAVAYTDSGSQSETFATGDIAVFTDTSSGYDTLAIVAGPFELGPDTGFCDDSNFVVAYTMFDYGTATESFMLTFYTTDTGSCDDSDFSIAVTVPFEDSGSAEEAPWSYPALDDSDFSYYADLPQEAINFINVGDQFVWYSAGSSQ